RPIFASLGKTAAALDSYRKALAIRETLAASDPADAENRRGLASGYLAMGRVLARNGDNRAAIDTFRKSLSLAEDLASRNPQDPKAQDDVSTVAVNLADALSRSGDLSGAR